MEITQLVMHFLLDIQIQSPDTFPHPAGVHYGLDNQGATCYLNSILQVLYITTEIHARFETTSLFCCRKCASLHIYICCIYTHTYALCKENINNHSFWRLDESQNTDRELKKIFETLEKEKGQTENLTQCLQIENGR